MASSGNKVKKGFASYLLILFILIIAAFLGCVVAMLVSPFTNVLGMHYYYYNYNKNFEKTDDNKDWDINILKEINISSNTANIDIKRDPNVDKMIINFVNKSKGFAKSSEDTNFSHTIEFEDEEQTILNISVDEPYGFLNLEDYVTINILLPVVSSYDFNNVEINVNTKYGNVYIGNNETLVTDLGNSKFDTSIKDLNITMQKGNIKFFENSENTFENLNINIDDGRVISQKEIKFTNELNIYSNCARFDLQDITYDYQEFNELMHINLNLEDAIFYVGKIVGNTNLNMQGGYFIADSIKGSINSNSAISQMKDGKIEINLVDGNVSLPYANKSNITIKEMTLDSQAYIHSTSGKITIEKLNGKAWLETTSGNVDVHTYNDDIEIITTSGKINLIYDCDTINNGVILKSNSGKITTFVKSNLSCVMKFHDKDGIYYDDDNGPSKVNLILHDIGFANPAIINDGTDDKSMLFYSDGKITVDLI